jgi:predicted nucleic acid-binding protein
MILDTSFLIDLMNRDAAAVSRAKTLERAGEDLRVPAPSLFELWRGVHLAAKTTQEAQKVTAILRGFPIAPLDAAAATRAGEVDADLIKQGAQIDPEDAMIAGIALELRQPLLTRNVRHFSRVPRLQVESY